jgi:threonine/homoserine/homoserine lactone efflux protein
MEIYLNEFMIIVVAHFIALLSPGADFVYLINTSINNKPKIAIGASLGIALSNGFYIMLCLLGYATVFSQSEFLMSMIRIIGGGYLLYLGLKILKTKSNILNGDGVLINQSTFIKEVGRGFYLSFLNPKISIFYISLFALAISKDTPLMVQLLYGVWMFLFVFVWDSMLVLLLNKKELKEKILSLIHMQKIMGILLLLIGGGLIYSLF